MQPKHYRSPTTRWFAKRSWRTSVHRIENQVAYRLCTSHCSSHLTHRPVLFYAHAASHLANGSRRSPLSGPLTDPEGPMLEGVRLDRDRRVYRGGGKDGNEQECRSARRNYTNSRSRLNDLGFRLILLEEEPVEDSL